MCWFILTRDRPISQTEIMQWPIIYITYSLLLCSVPFFLSLASLGQTTSAFQGDLQINPGTSNLTNTGQGKFEIDGGTTKVYLERLDAGDDIGDSYKMKEDVTKADKSETTESGTLSLLVFVKLKISILVLWETNLLCKFLKLTPDRETFRAVVCAILYICFLFYFIASPALC